MKLPNCKQKTIEGLLHTTREDTYTGGELIDIYHEYVLDSDPKKEYFLLLHNEEDIKGMLEIVAALAIPDLFCLPIKVKKVHANYYKDIHQNQCPEIIMTLKLPTALPTELSYEANGCYFIGNGEVGKLRVPIYEGELKYFYSNYKDYYYLPTEDVIFTPFFKKDYDDKELYFELTDEFKTKREDFNLYAHHILEMMGAYKPQK